MTPGKIFFSYSRQDAEAFAFKLASDLRTAGANVWIDQIDIPPGKNWDEEIERALNESKYILFIASERSVSSQNVLNEIYYAVDENKTVIPIRMHNCTIPFRIRRFQYIDFTGDYRAAFDRLVKHLDLQSDNETLGSNPEESLQSPVVKKGIVESRQAEVKDPASPPVKRRNSRIFIAIAAVVLAAVVVFGLLQQRDKPGAISGNVQSDSTAIKSDSSTITGRDVTVSDTSSREGLPGASTNDAVRPAGQSASLESLDESENAIVDVEAKYPGGRDAWTQHLRSTLNYPEQARREKLEGTVFVRFRVDSIGIVSNITAVDGPMGGGLRREAIRIVQNSGRWEPAIRNGRKVSVYKRISIPFKLENQSSRD